MTTTTMDVFVKRHHITVHDVAGLSEEHGFIHHLRSRGIAVSNVLQTADGATAITDDHWTYEVHSFASGIDLYRNAISWMPFSSRVHAHEAGKALARLHLAAADYAAPAGKAQPLVSSFTIFSQPDPLPTLETYIARRQAIGYYLQHRNWREETVQTLLPFHAALSPYLHELMPLWTRNDWHASNLLWTDCSAAARVKTVLDFGLSDRTCALHDLATAIERNIIEWLAIQDGRQDAMHLDLLDGYQLLLPLSARQWLAAGACGICAGRTGLFPWRHPLGDERRASLRQLLSRPCRGFNRAEGQTLRQHIAQRAECS